MKQTILHNRKKLSPENKTAIVLTVLFMLLSSLFADAKTSKQITAVKQIPSQKTKKAEAALNPITQLLQRRRIAVAEEMSTPSRKIVVAVIDTGCDTDHQDLKDHLWKNPSNQQSGYNFADNDENLKDRYGHGTHISGLILSQSEHVEIMCLRFYSTQKTGEENLNSTIKAFEYAIENGAQIINYSGGGLEPSDEERRMIKKAMQHNILVVAAAGNEGQDLRKQAFYPASYAAESGYTNLISVASLDKQMNILRSSNFQPDHVDIAALGKNMKSSLPDNKWGVMTGTSQATAVTSGKLAEFLYQHQNQYLTNEGDVINHKALKNDFLKNETHLEARLASKVRLGRVLNLTSDSF